MADLSGSASNRPHSGRQPIAVDRDSLAYLKSLNLKWNEISAILGPSSKTLQRRASWNIHRFTTISDQDLDQEVSSIRQAYPNAGEVMTQGHLLTRSIHVQLWRLRESLVRVRGTGGDGINRAIVRRTYSVPGPNHLLAFRR